MEPSLDTTQASELFQAIALVNNEDECRAFFRDLCTIAELEAMIERFQDAKLIEKGIPYRQIASQTRSSTATITRVAHWLQHGMGGYRLIIERLQSAKPDAIREKL